MSSVLVYSFASKNLTNIWAGIGAGTWAISKRKEPDLKALCTKSARMVAGSLGVLYCTETHSLTTPFVVYSPPNPNLEVANIWSDKEPWTFPFRIHCLGTPKRQLPFDQAMKDIPTLAGHPKRNFSQAFHVTATTAFVPNHLTAADWKVLIERLAEI